MRMNNTKKKHRVGFLWLIDFFLFIFLFIYFLFFFYIFFREEKGKRNERQMVEDFGWMSE